MKRVTCIVLNGGTASRMQPLAGDRVKSMLPFMGKPLLHLLVNSLVSQGFNDIVLTSSGKRGEVRSYFGSGESHQASIRYFEGGNWRGTAGTVCQVLKTMKISDPFMVIYGDSLLQSDFRLLVESHAKRRAITTILSHKPRFDAFLSDSALRDLPTPDSQTNFGVLDCDEEGRVQRFEEKPKLSRISEFSDPRANAAVYVVQHSCFDLIPEDALDFAYDVFPQLIKREAGLFAHALSSGYRIDIGTLSHYLSLQLAALRGLFPFHVDETFTKLNAIPLTSSVHPSATLVAPVFIGNSVRIGQNAVVACSIIGDEVQINANSSVRESILLENCVLGESVRINRSIIGPSCEIGADCTVPNQSVLGENCRLCTNGLILDDDIIRALI